MFILFQSGRLNRQDAGVPSVLFESQQNILCWETK